MSNLIEHAKKEFIALGYKPVDECEEGPNRWVQENVLELLEMFSKQGHSGFSAKIVIDYFKKLANFKPIAPIMCTDDEWIDVSIYNNDVTYQNTRCSAVFKNSINDSPYYLDAIVFVEDGNSSYTGGAFNKKHERITSSQEIKIPFIPKSFYVDVVDIDGEHHIKDESQLKEIWEYYEHQETKSFIRLQKLKALK